jgi:capsular polysaccharide biosynthesis protein
MELILILRVLLRRWYLALIPVVIVAVVVMPDILDEDPAVSGGFTTTVRYTAAQELDAIPNRDGDYQDVWLASELTVNAFTEWVRTSRFAQEVTGIVRDSGLEIDPDALSIAADNERSIGQIFINWGDEAELLTIAEAVITVLQTRSQAYFPQLGDVPAQVTLLDEPHTSPAPVSLPNRFAPFIKLTLAILAGVGLAFLVEYLDPTLRTREELQALGLPVIAGIPKR